MRAALVLLAVTASGLLVSRPASAEALLLVDADSGKVLEGENATYPWYPASVTKLMTSYVTFTALRARRINLDTLFTVSPIAASQSPTKMGFKPGTQLTVENALKMMLVHSANDMAVVLAEGVDGSIPKFAAEMNATAKRLGMTQTNYVNPNGLPDDDQVTSARDLAILARALIRDFPEYSSYWHIPSIRLGKKIYPNTNRMMDVYPGADGMKTGFICASGFNLVATATRDDKHLIAVVLGAPSSNVRALRAAQMLERGFAPNPLAWLAPSLGSVESLVPVEASPPNLREDICGKNHRRESTEEGEGEPATPDGDSGGQNAFLLSSLHGQPKGSPLTSGLAAAIPPVEVYTGPARGGGTVAAQGHTSNNKKSAAIAPKTSSARSADNPDHNGEVAAPVASERSSPAPTSASLGLKPWPGEAAPRAADTAAESSAPAPRAKPKPKPAVAAAKPKPSAKTETQ